MDCAWAKVLGALGFEVVADQRSEPHHKQDVASAAILAINAALIGGEDLAWRRVLARKTA